MLSGTHYELPTYNNKLSAQDSLSALQNVINAGAKIVLTGGSGLSVVAAMMGAATKYSECNPSSRMLIINHALIDPDLIDTRCGFWHFAAEANIAVKIRVLVNLVKT